MKKDKRKFSFVRDIEDLLYYGMKAQRKKLEQNNHKRSFDDVTAEYCIKRIHEELVELEEAHTAEEQRSEAADIANFCHMLIMHCNKKLADTVENDKKCGNVQKEYTE
jgi:hypothetical protein